MSNLTLIESVEQFDDLVANAETTVLVDFFADWCGPCKMVLPILEDLSTVLEDKVTIAKVNIESEAGTELAARFAVRGIPTMITFNEGTQQKVKVGAASKPDIISLITESAGE